MNVLGIDPGLKGAIAQYDGYALKVLEMPIKKSTSRGHEIDWSKLHCQWIYDFRYPTDQIFLEQVSSRPGEGVSSAFKFGTVYGGLQAMAASMSIDVTKVTPRTWKKYFGLGPDKKDAVAHAVSLFPEYEELFYGPRGGLRDGIAEAALIAFYGRHQMMKG